ncbi:MAG: DNRLRE domain-containing protein [Patescibacteria group bacterium]
MHQKTEGFTIIELLIASAIIALLATSALVSSNTAKARARNTKRTVEARTLLDALLNYQMDHEEALPAGITATPKMLGTSSSSCRITCNTGGEGGETNLTLFPLADSYIYQFTPNSNYGSDPLLHVYPWTPSYSKRSIIRFSLAGIPSEVTVTSATLWLKENINGGRPRTIAAHRVTRDWTEFGVSWNRYTAINPWTAPGGDYNQTASAQTQLSWNGIHEWDGWNLTQDVQDFVNGAAANYGWLLKDVNEDNSQFYWYFPSKESADDPYLSIAYTDMDNSPTADACLDLSPELVVDYISRIPIDPSIGTAEKTYYTIRKAANGEIIIKSCGAELGEAIVMRGS